MRLSLRFGVVLFLALAAGVAGFGLAGGRAESSAIPAHGAAASSGPNQTNGPAPLMLPVLSFIGPTGPCAPWLSVMNAGTAATKAVLVVWPAPGETCSGPLKVECSGLIAPAASWNMVGPQIPVGSSSGVLYSFDPRPLDELGIVDVPDLAADYMCERLFFGTVGNCSAFSAFHNAYIAGGMFEDEIDMSRIRGQPIVASVVRHCPGSDQVAFQSSSSYLAVPLVPDASGPVAPDRYEAVVFPLDGVPAARGPFVNVQSASSETNSIVVETTPLGGAPEWTPCEQVSLYLGETAHVDLQGCLALDTWHTVRAVGTGPLAITADRYAGDTLASWEGVGLGASVDASGAPELPATTVAGPLAPTGNGWATRVAVLVRGSEAASVAVHWFDEAGTELLAETRTVCGGCVDGFVAPSQGEESWGTVRVDSGAPAGGPGAPIEAALVAVQPTQTEGRGFGYALARVGTADVQHLAPFVPTSLRTTGITTRLAVGYFGAEPAGIDVAFREMVTNDVGAIACAHVATNRVANLEIRPGDSGNDTNGAGKIGRSDGTPDTGSTVVAIRNESSTLPDEPIPGDETAVTLAPAVILAADSAAECTGYVPPLRTDSAAPAERARFVRSAIRLPVLDYVGQDMVCEDEIAVENVGSQPAVAVLMTWGEPSFCAPQCAGALHVVCSGLIRPDEEWVFSQDVIVGALSAVVYGARALTLDEIGATPGGSQLAAQELCLILTFEAVGDCDDVRRFQLAWATGGTFGGIPLAPLAYPDMRVTTHRRCPFTSPDIKIEYPAPGIAADRFDPSAHHEGRFVQSVVPVHADDDWRTVLYIQNGGLRCTEALLTFHRGGDFGGETNRCEVFTIPSSETWQFDVEDCVSDWDGSVVIESQEPLAVWAEAVFGDAPRGAAGRNRSNPYDLDGDGRVDLSDLTIVNTAMCSTPSASNWDPMADLDADGAVTDQDWLVLVDNLDDGVNPPAAPGPCGTATTPPPSWTIYLPYAERPRRTD